MHTRACTRKFHGSFICNKTKFGNNPTSINRWIDKQSVVYPNNGIFFSSKKDKLLIHTVTWISLRTIMLSERSQTKKTGYCRIPSRYNSENANQSTVSEGRAVVALGGAGQREGWPRGRRKVLGVMDVFTFLIVVIDSFVYTDVSKLVKVHILFCTVYFMSTIPQQSY